MKPQNVISPKEHWHLISVLYTADEGSGPWSLAVGRWDGNLVMAARWDGRGDFMLGNPSSRGKATWFVLPDGMADAILANVPIPEDQKIIYTSLLAAEVTKKAA
jgi:hypothetical protein